MLAGAVFSLDGCELHMGGGHFRLHEELAPGRANANGLYLRRGFDFHQGEA
jgi:hypothetical protein